MLLRTISLATQAATRTSVGTKGERGRRSRRPIVEILEQKALLSSIMDLGPEGYNQYSYSSAYINNHGEVAFTSYAVDGVMHAYLYGGGKITDLGTLPGFETSEATGINDSGEVVGNAYAIDGTEHAFLYSDGKMTDLGTLGGTYSEASGINDAGQILGNSTTIQYLYTYIYVNSHMTILNNSGFYGYAINDSGLVAGVQWSGLGFRNAAIFDNGVIRNLGSLCDACAAPVAINNLGQVAGNYDYSTLNGNGPTHAFSYKAGIMTDLGTLGGDPNYDESYAAGINNLGQVVGLSSNTDYSAVAFLYGQQTGMVDLNSLLPPNSKWDLTAATAINDYGQIVGYGTNPEGQVHAFLLNLEQPDISVNSASTTDAQNIKLNYSLNGSGIAQTFQLAVYRSPTSTFNMSTAVPVGSPVTIPATDSNGNSSTTQGQHTVTVSLPSGIPADTSGKDPYVFVVANPQGTNHIPESDDPTDANDVTSLALPAHITATSVAWATGGGVDFNYSVTGQDLASPTTVALYWAPTPSFDSARDTLILGTSTKTQTAMGDYGPVHVTGWFLGASPPVYGTNYLLEVADPNNQVGGFSNDQNVKAIPLPDIALSSVTTTDWQDIDLNYSIEGADLGLPFQVAVYRSPSKTFDPSTAVATGIQATIPATDSNGKSSTTQGTHSLTLTLSKAIAPDTSGSDPYVFVVANPAGKSHIPESDDPTDTNDVASLSTLTMTQATSPDPHDISFTYNIAGAPLTSSFDVKVFRSDSSTFDPSKAIQVGDAIQVPPSATGGASNLSMGSHTVVIPDPQALKPDPLHEYVFVIAYLPDQNGQFDFSATVPQSHQAHYRKFVLGVVSHGFNLFGQIPGVPGWETQMATDLYRIDKYDFVIPFDWVATSNLPVPGLALRAGNSLASQISTDADLLVAASGSPGDVVDLDLIGHSRGAVVISRALQDLNGTKDPVLAGGFVKMTLLDPHPANNDYGPRSLRQGSNVAANIFGPDLAAFQDGADDPPVVIPSNVDSWDDIYQNTPASSAFGLNLSGEGFLNLWGDDPSLVINQSRLSPSVLQNITSYHLSNGALIGHTEVPYWYVENYAQYRGLIFTPYQRSVGGAALVTLPPQIGTQQTVGTDTSNVVGPAGTQVVETTLGGSTSSVQPTGSDQAASMTSQAMAPVADGVAAPSSLSDQPAQPTSTKPGIGQTVPLAPPVQLNPIPSVSVARHEARKLKVLASVPFRRAPLSPRMRPKATGNSTPRKLSWEDSHNA